MKMILPFLLLFSFASSSIHFPYRKVLSLKTLHRKRTTCAFEKSYIVQRIIWLFWKYCSNDSAQVLLRNIILDSVMEDKGEVFRQGKAFSQMVSKKSKGMISGLYKKENSSLGLSAELKILFKGAALASVKQYNASPSQDQMSISSNTDKSGERWEMLGMSEAVVAWKQFSTYYEFAPRSDKLTKVLNTKCSQINIRERMNLYLNSYERFLKPTVNQFDLGNSYAKIMTVYYYFQYLQHISRIYALYLTVDQLDHLKRKHKEFIKNTKMLATTITLQRTSIGAFPFEGRWLYNTELENGILVPNKLNAIELISQFKMQMPLQKVSLYRVNEQDSNSSAVCIRLLVVEEKYLELKIHFVRADWDQVWLGKGNCIAS